VLPTVFVSDENNDRRRQPRHEVRIVTEIDATSSGESVVGVLTEISLSGGRFLTNTALDKGTEVQLGIHLDLEDPSRVALLTGTVVRSERLTASERGSMWHFELGVKFVSGMDEAAIEIEALAASIGSG
jgi:PilZ domain